MEMVIWILFALVLNVKECYFCLLTMILTFIFFLCSVNNMKLEFLVYSFIPIQNME